MPLFVMTLSPPTFAWDDATVIPTPLFPEMVVPLNVPFDPVPNSTPVRLRLKALPLELTVEFPVA